MVDEILTIEKPTKALVAFKPEMERPMCHTVAYQVLINPENLSPSGDWIRFNYEENGETVNEIHGWKAVDEIVILEILEGARCEQAPKFEAA